MDDRLERSFVSPDDTVGVAMRRMNDSAARIVLVVDDGRRLLGVATDGDVRRWILGGRGLDEPMADVMNTTPVTVASDWTREAVERVMVARRIECVPVVDDGRVVDAVWWTDLFEGPAAPKRAIDLPVVIMAGGLGSRLGTLSKVLPKPLVPIGETPILELIMDRFAEFGCDSFHVTVNYKANLIKAYFSDVEHDYDIDFVVETEPLGTGGSLSLLRDTLDSTFVLTNCDVLLDADYADILEVHRASGNAITLVASMQHMTVPYGVCDVAEGGRLTAIREKPQFDFLVSTGFYILEASVLADVPDATFYHVTDIINDYIARGLQVGVYPVPEAAWVDVGQLDELQRTLDAFGAS